MHYNNFGHFLNSYVLHGNVATQLERGGIYHIIANYLQNASVLLKIGQLSAKILTK